MRTWIVVAALVALPLSLAGCGGDGGGITGSWTFDVDTTKEGLSDEHRKLIEAMEQLANNMPGGEGGGEGKPLEVEVVVNADGTFIGKNPGGDMKGSWKQEGDKYVFTDDEGSVTNGTLKGGKLYISAPDMPFAMVLKKK